MGRFAKRAALVAAVAAGCGAGLVAAPTAHAQVVAAAGTTPVLAAANGSNNSLDFYSRNDVSGWGKPEQVAGPGAATSEPSVAQLGSETGIAVQGPNDSLDFYLQASGASTWSRAQVVAGAGSTPWQPALAYAGHDAEIAAQGPGDALEFYSEPVGFYYRLGHAPTWSQQPVSGFASGSPAGPYDEPAIAQAGDYTVISAIGPNATLYLFWQQIGSTTWRSAEVAGAKSTYIGTAIAQIGNSVVIAAGSENTMYTYTLPIGLLSSPTISASSWTPDLVYSDTQEGVDEPSIAQVGNSVVVLDNVDSRNAQGEIISAMTTFWQPIGSGQSWAKQTVRQGGNIEGSIEQVGQSVVIGASLDNGTGYAWWESASGTGPWNPEAVG